MFGNKSIASLVMVGYFGIGVIASSQVKGPVEADRSLLNRIRGIIRPESPPRSNHTHGTFRPERPTRSNHTHGRPPRLPRQISSSSSGSSSHSSQTQVSSFMSSWQSLSQSFSQCRSAFSQRSSIDVATQSVQELYAQYQAAVNQYQSCFACASYLSQSGHTSQIQQTVTQMYSAFQSIISTGQQYYGERFQNQFASTFKDMSSFGSFSQRVCSSAGVDLPVALNNGGINLDMFSKSGINLGINLGGLVLGGDGGLSGGVGGILGGNGEALVGSVSGALGGGSSGGHGLLGDLLG